MLALVVAFFSKLGSDALAQMALGLFKELMARNDLKEATRLEILTVTQEYAIKALEWERAADGLPDRGGDLRVRPGARPIVLSGGDPGAGSGPH